MNIKKDTLLLWKCYLGSRSSTSTASAALLGAQKPARDWDTKPKVSAGRTPRPPLKPLVSAVPAAAVTGQMVPVGVPAVAVQVVPAVVGRFYGVLVASGLGWKSSDSMDFPQFSFLNFIFSCCNFESGN